MTIKRLKTLTLICIKYASVHYKEGFIVASFRKRNGLWEYRISYKNDLNEYKVRSKGGFSTKKEAELAARKKETELEETNSIKEMKITDFLTEWYSIYIVNKRKPNTQKTYWMSIKNHVIPAIGYLKVNEMNPLLYQKFIDSLIEKGLSKESAKRVHTPVRLAFQQAVINGFLNHNPTAYVKIEKKEVKKLKYLNPEYITALLEFIYKRSYDQGIYFECLFESGMRKGECSALEFDDINWNESTIKIDETYDYQATKDEKKLNSVKTETSSRTILMRTEFMKKLRIYMKYKMEKRTLIGSLYNQNQNFIFGRDDGTAFPKSTLYNTFSKALEHIEHEHLPIHSTRHTHAVMMLEAGASMKELQNRLGHASMQVTADTYSHVTKKMETRAVELFDIYMNKK